MTNQELLQYIGFTQKEKILNDAAKILLENKAKKLGFLPKPALISLVTVSENEEIKSIGGSIPSDLITNQFGELFAQFHGSTGLPRLFNIQDLGNVAREIRVAASAQNSFAAGEGGSQVQVGQGSTTPTRADFNIETPFANGGLEDGLISTELGVYNSSLGQITVTGVFGLTTGAGTITESILVWQFQDTSITIRSFAMAHDAISPGVSFVASQIITVNYIWQL